MDTALATEGGLQSLSRIAIPTMCLQIQFFQKDGQLHIEQLTPLPSFTHMMGNSLLQRINFFSKLFAENSNWQLFLLIAVERDSGIEVY